MDSEPAKIVPAAVIENGRLHGIDALRGLAALIVVLWHWQHMYWPPAANLGFSRAAQPAYAALWPLYDAGWMAVDLFFCISGFVFFSLYKDRIESGRITARKFSLLRLSRLYPLHVATLVLVAALQLVYLKTFGSTFVYGGYDLPHFLLNLFMLNGFVFAGGESFNGPSWSLSIEMFLYAVFFLAAGFGALKSPARVIGLIVLGVIVGHFDKGAGRGLVAFFAGGLVYYIVQNMRRDSIRGAWLMAAALVLAWSALLLEVRGGWLEREVVAHLPRGLAILESRFRGLALNLLVSLVMFPATVLVVIRLEKPMAAVWRRLSWLGDLSYSAYLLHVPLQIALIFTIQKLGLDRHAFVTGWAMIGFLAVLYGVAWLSYNGFERPAQDAWRRAALPRQATPVPAE
jgi:peptidoglycan/LPS O-acetylase OafA/YrhL